MKDDDLLREELNELMVRLNYAATFEPRIGDHACIQNQREHHPSEDIIQGFCSNGKLKIGDGKVFVLRLPKNIARTTRGV